MKCLRVILIVLLLGCCTLWVASYWKITWINSDNTRGIIAWDGLFEIGIDECGTLAPRPSSGVRFSGYTGLSTRWWPIFKVDTYPPCQWYLFITFWLPTLLFSLPLAISAYLRARRRRRSKQGLCIRCGYDLSGTDHTLCPECGTEVVKA